MTKPKDESTESREYSMIEHLIRQGVSRRQFMTACSAMTATLAVPAFRRRTRCGNTDRRQRRADFLELVRR